MNVQGINQKIIHQTVGFTGKTANLEQIGRELTESLSVKATNLKVKAMLERISDLSLLKDLKIMPEGRLGGYLRADAQFQEEVRKLVYYGTIKPQTMVIAYTGHNIPILAELHKNDKLKFNSAFVSKFWKDEFDFVTPTIKRTADQAYTFGNKIKQAESNIVNPNSLFIGVEGHKGYKVDTALLPTAAELKDLGINRIVCLLEAPPERTITSANPEFKDYFEKLEQGGLQIIYKGVDPRHSEMPNSYEYTYKSLYESPESPTLLIPRHLLIQMDKLTKQNYQEPNFKKFL